MIDSPEVEVDKLEKIVWMSKIVWIWRHSFVMQFVFSLTCKFVMCVTDVNPPTVSANSFFKFWHITESIIQDPKTCPKCISLSNTTKMYWFWTKTFYILDIFCVWIIQLLCVRNVFWFRCWHITAASTSGTHINVGCRFCFFYVLLIFAVASNVQKIHSLTIHFNCRKVTVLQATVIK